MTATAASSAKEAARRRAKDLIFGLEAHVVTTALRYSGLRLGVAVIYHGLSPARLPDPRLVPTVAAPLFEEQVRRLARTYRIVAASDLRRAIARRAAGERIPLAITFDDDLASHVDIAVPVLRRHGATATFFLTGSGLDGPSAFWWELLQALVDEKPGHPALDELFGPGASRLSPTRLAERLEPLPPEQKQEVSRRLLEVLGAVPEGCGLAPEQVRRLVDAGMEIGFHTREHPRLTALDDDELEAAMRDGRAEVEAAAGRELSLIAYPHGAADARVAQAAHDAGFTTAFTTVDEAIGMASDRMLLGRVYGSERSAAELDRRLSRALLRLARSGEGDTPIADVGTVEGQLRQITDEVLPTVSVVIPTRNRPEGVREIVEAALKDRGTSEVVVVVDGDDEGRSAAVLAALAEADPRVRFEVIANRGAGGARQHGVELATGEVVLVLDDDVVPGPGLASGHARRHAREEGLVVAGYMPTAPEPDPVFDVTRRLYDRYYHRNCEGWQSDPDSVLLSLWAGNLSLRRSDALRIGFESPDGVRGYNADQDFGLRCHRAGLRGVFDPALRAEHRFRRPIDRFLADARDSGLSAWSVYAIHADVLGPYDTGAIEDGLLPPAAAVARAARRPRVRSVVLPVLAGLAPVAARAGLQRVASAAVETASRIERRRAVVTLAGGGAS